MPQFRPGSGASRLAGGYGSGLAATEWQPEAREAAAQIQVASPALSMRGADYLPRRQLRTAAGPGDLDEGPCPLAAGAKLNMGCLRLAAP